MRSTGKSYFKKVEQVYVLELVFKDEIDNPKYFSMLGTEYLFKIFKTLPPLHKRDPFLPFVQIQEPLLLNLPLQSTKQVHKYAIQSICLFIASFLTK